MHCRLLKGQHLLFVSAFTHVPTYPLTEPLRHNMASLLKRASHLLIGHHAASLAKRFPLACWTSYGVLGKALPTCLLDIVWCPWQNTSFLPVGHRMAFLAKHFPLACWTSYGVLGKALPSCLLDIVWRSWQSALRLPGGHRMVPLAKRLLLAY